MSKKIIIPYLNPIKFHKITPTTIPQYLSKYHEDFPFFDTQQPWDSKRNYYQPWQQNDSIRLQIEANYGPVPYKIIDADGRIYVQDNFQQIALSANDGFAINEINKPLTSIPEGIYFLQLDNLYISEPLKILVFQKGTVLLEYKHSSYKGDVIWATGFSPSARVRGLVRSADDLSSKDSLFEDTNLNLTLEESKEFEVSKFLVGGAPGIPIWYARRIWRMSGCSTFKIDGIQWTRSNPKMEPTSIERYAMRSYVIEVRDTLNRNSTVFEDDNVQHNKTSMIATVLGDGFGMNNGNGSEQQITVFI
jgi:hypothetical protein